MSSWEIQNTVLCKSWDTSTIKKPFLGLERSRNFCSTFRRQQETQKVLIGCCNMLKSDQIKSEIDRLTFEATSAEKSLQVKRTVALNDCDQIDAVLLHFFSRRQNEIETTKRKDIHAARQSFEDKYAALQKHVQSNDGLAYAQWDSPIWSSFDIQKGRPAHDLTRLGMFTVTGEDKQFRFPATVSILGGKNILLRAKGSEKGKARRVLRNIAFRLLVSVPPGKLRFTFIDPVELGSTAAGLVGTLPDFLTGGLAWHEEQDIQEQLSLIETRIAAIKTKYLGIKFSSIEEYNAHAGTIEEPYWLIVVSDCPNRFRDTALQKLLSIAKNGPPAGVYLAIMLDDNEKKCADDFVIQLAETANRFIFPENGPAFFEDSEFQNVSLDFDNPPSANLIETITTQVNKTAADAQSVKVNWEAPLIENWWKEDARYGIKIPLGTYGARQIQSFEIDEKLLNSALIIGKPGSGKSRLLHVLVAGLMTRYSPNEISLYLLDCKQVEFKDYATHKLPHARVVAIESEREFGLSVLRRLNAELDARKTEFSACGETSLSSYRDKTGKPMSRIILIIDEFHELLNSDDALAREAAAILDRLVRLGRALGINVILASQTLSGQSTLLSSTKNQIPIRIVLQCSESDSISALSQENDEARLLERPGEAIYNSGNGRRESNNRFQVSWLSDETIESLLKKINVRADEKSLNTSPPIIFDGNSLADIRQNSALNSMLRDRKYFQNKGAISAWLGDPIEMKEATAAAFKRQSRSNLLILGQNEYEQACVSMILASMISIAVQQSPEAARFLILNLSDPAAEWNQCFNILKECLPHHIDLISKNQISEKLIELAALLDKRAGDPASTDNASIYLFIIGLHRERNLRRTDGGFSRPSLTSGPKPASNADLLSKICRDGSVYGIHCAIWCDVFSNFERVFQRNDIDEFSLRVALQMSESDSRSLIDSDAANRLGNFRAVFFDDEKHGRLEKFRPYSQITKGWLENIARELKK